MTGVSHCLPTGSSRKQKEHPFNEGASPLTSAPRQRIPLPHRHDLAGIENVLRIERLLQGAHGVDRLWAKLGLEVFLLALPDAVLAGAGAAHRLRALDQAMHEVLAARHFLRVVDVADQRTVEVAVADMADDRR